MTISVSGSVITFSDATTQSTAAVAGGVTSLNGQTGAITDTSSGAIGSYTAGASASGGANTVIGPGTTVAGSTLYGINGGGGFSSFTQDVLSNGTGGGGASTANYGYSGTWRAASYSKNGSANKSGVYGCGRSLFVRIS